MSAAAPAPVAVDCPCDVLSPPFLAPTPALSLPFALTCCSATMPPPRPDPHSHPARPLLQCVAEIDLRLTPDQQAQLLEVVQQHLRPDPPSAA